MAKEVKKKTAEQASNIFHNIMKASVKNKFIDQKDIICDKCNTEYILRSYKAIHRDKDEIHCGICGTKLYSWDEAKNWVAIKLKREEQ